LRPQLLYYINFFDLLLHPSLGEWRLSGPAFHSLIGRLHTLNQEIEIKGEVLQIKQHIMGQMGDAEKLTYQNQVLATWKKPKSSFRLDTKQLEKDRPDLATQYQLEIEETRRLVIKDYQSNPVLTQK